MFTKAYKRKNAPRAKVSNFSAGFTLVEMIVSVALFAMVVLLSVSSLLVLISANQKARTLKTAMDNLNLVIDDMSQDLRLGSKYFCSPSASSNFNISIQPGSEPGRDCPYFSGSGGGPYLAFRDRYGKIVLYRFDVTEPEEGRCIKKRVTKTDWSAGYNDQPDSLDLELTKYACLTSGNIIINELRFYVDKTHVNSNSQPHIMIVVKGTVGSETESTRTSFSLMTSVSQRIPHNVE